MANTWAGGAARGPSGAAGQGAGRVLLWERWLPAGPLGEDRPAGRPAQDEGRKQGAGPPPLASVPISFEKCIGSF